MKITKKKVKGTLLYEVTGYLGSYVDPNGNKKQKNFHGRFNTSSEAKIAFQRAKNVFKKQSDQLNIGDFNSHPTFKAVYDTWLETYKETVKEATLNHVLVIFEQHVLPVLGNKQIKKITWQDCQRLVLNWKKEYKTYSKFMSYTSLIFRRAVKLGIIPANPMDLVDIPKKHVDVLDNNKHNYWSLQQLKEFLASVYNEDHDIRYDRITLFYLLATTGMRKGEALALTWNDVDLQQHLVSINKTVSRSLHNKQIIATPKTINAYRTLALDKATSKSINEYKKSLPKIPKATDFIFQNAAGNMMSLMTPNHWLAHFIKETGLPKISVHGLRHTFASVQVTNKINPKAVQMQLGHADAEITLDVYTHMERDQVSADILDIGSLI